jgi:hypothetical protein
MRERDNKILRLRKRGGRERYKNNRRISTGRM